MSTTETVKQQQENVDEGSQNIKLHNNINVEELQQIVKKVSDSKITYALVTCPEPNLSKFDVVESCEKEGGIAAIRTDKELRKYFDEFRELFMQKFKDQKTGCYIPYDFGFYLDEE